MSKTLWIGVTSAVVVIAGVLLVAFGDTRGNAPALTCAEQGMPTSGFTDPKRDNCPVNTESFDAWAKWRSQPQPLKIVGAAAVVAGVVGLVGVGIAAIVQKSRSRAQ